MKDRHTYRLVRNGKAAVLLGGSDHAWSTWSDRGNEWLSMAFCPEIALMLLNKEDPSLILAKAEKLFPGLVGIEHIERLRIEWVPLGKSFYIKDHGADGERIEYPDSDTEALTA